MWIMDVEHPDSIKLETIPSTNSPPPPLFNPIFSSLRDWKRQFKSLEKKEKNKKMINKFTYPKIQSHNKRTTTHICGV